MSVKQYFNGKLKVKLAVLLPVYNSELFIEKCINSILSQTYKYFHLHVFDDGSYDNSADLIHKICDERLFYHKSDQNLGLSTTLNWGLEILNENYDFIARMDADDVCFPKRLELQLKHMLRNPEISLCGTQGYWSDNIDGENWSNWTYPISHYEIKIGLLFSACFGHSSVMFRTSFLREFQLKYNPRFQVTEDWELWARAINLGKFENMPDFLMKYRVHSRSNHRALENLNKHRNEKSYILSKYWQNFGISFPESLVKKFYFEKKVNTSEFRQVISIFNKLSEREIKIEKKIPNVFIRRMIRMIFNCLQAEKGVIRRFYFFYLMIFSIRFSSKIEIIKNLR